MTVLKDASSRFSKNTRWGTFPSVALGWTLTEEPWLKDNKEGHDSNRQGWDIWFNNDAKSMESATITVDLNTMTWKYE